MIQEDPFVFYPCLDLGLVVKDPEVDEQRMEIEVLVDTIGIVLREEYEIVDLKEEGKIHVAGRGLCPLGSLDYLRNNLRRGGEGKSLGDVIGKDGCGVDEWDFVKEVNVLDDLGPFWEILWRERIGLGFVVSELCMSGS